jgi:hypothetical protein
MVAKATSSAQQTTKSGQVVTTTFSGQKKKMKNLTVFKTVLAPNAPWPKWETVEKPKTSLKKVSIARENGNLDYFLQTYEELNNYKTASAHRTRDKLSGRFKSNRGLEK